MSQDERVDLSKGSFSLLHFLVLDTIIPLHLLMTPLDTYLGSLSKYSDFTSGTEASPIGVTRQTLNHSIPRLCCPGLLYRLSGNRLALT